jgi:hypothetical protein
MTVHKRPGHISTLLLTARGLWPVGLGGSSAFWRPPLLPEDLRYIGMGQDHLQVAAPGLGRCLRRVFMVMGGFITGVKILTVFAVRPASGQPSRRCRAAGVVTGFSQCGTHGKRVLESKFDQEALVPSAAEPDKRSVGVQTSRWEATWHGQ